MFLFLYYEKIDKLAASCFSLARYSDMRKKIMEEVYQDPECFESEVLQVSHYMRKKLKELVDRGQIVIAEGRQ